jgi:DNA repair exonuclease SbcCD ATPase subunit
MPEGTTPEQEPTTTTEIDYTEQFQQLITNTEHLKTIDENNAEIKTKIEELQKSIDEIKTKVLEPEDPTPPGAQEIVLSTEQIEDLQTVALSEEQIQRFNKKYEKELNETVAIYFSIILGIVLAYIALKGLFSHWKST